MDDDYGVRFTTVFTLAVHMKIGRLIYGLICRECRLSTKDAHAEPVYLNVYDLSPMNDYTYDVGIGFYHSGVQVHGDEWTFSTSGVFYHRPQQAPNVKFRTKILLGTVNYTSSKVIDIVNSLRDDFQGERYHLLNHNCNCFSESLTFALLNKHIPSYVNRLANIGSSISCLSLRVCWATLPSTNRLQMEAVHIEELETQIVGWDIDVVFGSWYETGRR